MTTSGQTPPTRKQRRAVERATQKAPVVTTTIPAWRSPVVLMSLAALAVGVVLVAVLAAGTLRTSAEPLRTASVAAPSEELRDGRSLGSADAPVTIEVHSDPQCPSCGAFARDVEPLLMAKYIRNGQLRLVYRDFAFLGQESTDAAVGMRAAEQLAGRFWEYHDIVYANQKGENKGAFARERLGDMAAMVGLDRDAFLALLDEPDLIAAVGAETAEGVALGVTATPTLIINGAALAGLPSWEDLSSYIDGLLASPVPSEAPSSAP